MTGRDVLRAKGGEVYRVLSVALLLVAVASPFVQGLQTGPVGLDITLRARSFQPGELVVVGWTLEAEASSVQVRVFDRTTSASRVGLRRWEALVGIDLDQRPGDYALTAVRRRRSGRHGPLGSAQDLPSPPAERQPRLREPAAVAAGPHRRGGALRTRRFRRFGARSAVDGTLGASCSASGQQQLRHAQRVQRRGAQPPYRCGFSQSRWNSDPCAECRTRGGRA